MQRNIVLHIGMEKTGTTTIQKFCAVNRDVFAHHGFYYPRSVGVENHRDLASYAMNLDRADDNHRENGLADPEERKKYRVGLETNLADEIAGLSPDIHTLVFSNEHCHSRLCYKEEIERLRDWLAPYASHIRILVYLRRQDEVATSLYSTGLRAGLTRYIIFPDPKTKPDIFRHFFNYDHSLAMWEDVFGEDNVDIRIFDKSAFPNGNIIEDFLGACGLPEDTISECTMIPNQNESIKPLAQEFLRRMNEFIPRFLDEAPNPKRGKLPHLIAEAYVGGGRKPSRAAAENFMQHFTESNEKLRQRKFPDRDSLFSMNFDKYPEETPNLDLSFDTAVEISARLWEETVEEMEALRKENTRLKNVVKAQKEKTKS